MIAAIDSMIAALQSGRLADPSGLKEWATPHRAFQSCSPWEAAMRFVHLVRSFRLRETGVTK